jgi:hypothetical protein
MSRACYGVISLLLCWLLMQAVHEAGHALAGWLVGDHVVQVVLHPLSISRTDLSPGLQPVWTTVAGPLCGVTMPLFMWGIAAACRLSPRHWLRFFAGFCLIANGAYLGMAVVAPVGDAEVLLQQGVPIWVLGLFGLVTVPMGFGLWHGLGAEFGWGPNGRAIAWRETGILGALLLLVVVIECASSAMG